MASTIKTQIIDNVITALKGIKESDGYSRTVRSVKRIATSLVSPARDLVFVESTDETKTTLNNVVTEVVLSLVVGGIVQERTTVDVALDNMSADIEKALLVDVTRNDLAKDTKIVRTESDVSEETESLGGVLVFVEITYRHAHGNPYSGV